MTSEKIKTRCEELYETIKKCEIELKQIRTDCRHDKTFMGKYSFRVGNIIDAKICLFCGEVVG